MEVVLVVGVILISTAQAYLLVLLAHKVGLLVRLQVMAAEQVVRHHLEQAQ